MKYGSWLVALVGCGGVGGPVDGPADAHCDGVEPVIVDPTTCDASPTSRVADGGDDYGDTLYGTSGDDDDCKYHVSWSSSDVTRSGGTDFDLTLMYLADMSAATGAEPRVEAFLDDTTPAEDGGAATESGDGKYTISGVKFGEKGQWTVRFHFFESCVDGETSPHGHVAFYLDVP